MPFLLAAGDIACFATFTLIGVHTHGEAMSTETVMRGGGMFALAWLALAVVAGLYGRRAFDLKAATTVWTVAWLAGLALRWLAFGHAPRPGFGLVALLFVGALLLGWRTLVSRLLMRGGSAAAPR